MNFPPNQVPDAYAEAVRGYRPLEALLPTHWQSATVRANSIAQHYYRTGGDRPPLVLLHGIMEGALVWLPAARALEADYDVIMLDTRGHGGSARVAGDFSPDTLVADVAAALRALGLERVHLLGFSQGASTAVLLADRHPDLVGRLVLAGMAEGSGPIGNPMESPAYRAWLDRYIAWLERLPTLDHTERMQAGLEQLMPGAPLLPEEDYVAWIENCARLDLDLMRMSGELWGGLGETVKAMQAAIARLECPTLIIKSSFAPVSSGPLHISEEPGEQPNIRVLRFENTGHVIYRDRPAEFTEQVRSFFGEK
ncbi:MAG TPA: alpha/beta hydrolase [Roseiflexaceae bacterium]|nr:alpha/beta hydrolase [Roseiflexaceae bacterium]